LFWYEKKGKNYFFVIDAKINKFINRRNLYKSRLKIDNQNISKIELNGNSSFIIGNHFLELKMGKSNSKNVEQNTIESDGQVNNNFVIQDRVDVYSQELVILLKIISLIKILEFGYFINSQHNRSLKKKFERNQKVILPN